MEKNRKMESSEMDNKEFFQLETLFRSRYKGMKEEKEKSVTIPESVEKNIFHYAAASLQKRVEKRRQWRKWVYLAACFAVMTFVFVLFPEREKNGFAKGNDLAKNTVQMKKTVPDTYGVNPSSGMEYEKYTQSRDETDWELYSLNARLDVVSLEAELIGHHS